MPRGGIALAYAVIIATVVVAPISFAFRDGADPNYTGGSLSGGANCTECHGYNEGSGTVELLGVGRRYIAGATYDLTVHVTDSDELGAGFEISAETPTSHAGTLLLSDAVHTRFSGPGGSDPNYVTHTLGGVLDSVANWSANGHSVNYHMQWQAPLSDVGPVHLLGAGVSMNNNEQQQDDKYYATYATVRSAEPFDADGDTDGDLFDAAILQRCFGATVAGPLDPCAYMDDGDNDVALNDWATFVSFYFDGPTAADPAGYVLADAVRGGLMYDRWWVVVGAPTPTGDHPLYPEAGTQSGSSTFRCKECHGWDYKGVDGAYGSGSHYTGIVGVHGTSKTPRGLFDLLKADPVEVPNGHDMDAYGMSDQDIWDVVKLCLEGTVDTDNIIDNTGAFVGTDPDFAGWFLYGGGCATCHGEDGTAINFGSAENPEYIGGVARSNPWEVLHKMRFGQPGAPMRGAEFLGWSDGVYANVGAFCQTLP